MSYPHTLTSSNRRFLQNEYHSLNAFGHERCEKGESSIGAQPQRSLPLLSYYTIVAISIETVDGTSASHLQYEADAAQECLDQAGGAFPGHRILGFLYVTVELALRNFKHGIFTGPTSPPVTSSNIAAKWKPRQESWFSKFLLIRCSASHSGVIPCWLFADSPRN